MPSSVPRGGNALTITGGAKRTTADGLRFFAGANSFCNLGAIHNSAAKLWVSFRFKLFQNFAAGSANSFQLFGKRVDDNNLIHIYMDIANGFLYFRHLLGGVTATITTGQSSWSANTWYHVLASISDTAGHRLRIDNGGAATHANTQAAPAGGNLVFGDRTTTLGESFSGIMTDVIMGTDDLTTDEEADLYKGVPPLDAVNLYTCDEGRGTTINDRGSGGNNGILGSAASWAFGSCRRPVLSLDGLNDRATSGAAPIQNLTGGQTIVWVAKAKSTYSGLSRVINPWQIGDIGGQNFLELAVQGGAFRAGIVASGLGSAINLNHSVTIDDYLIIVVTFLGSSGVLNLYSQGYLIGSATRTGMAATAVRVWLGEDPSETQRDVSKTLLLGVADGVFTARQVRDYSHWLNDTLSLGVSI